MVVSTLRLFPPREQRRHVLSVLRSVLGPTQAQPHCRSCHLFEEDGYDEAILFMEQWDEDEAFFNHVRSELYNRVLAAVELSRIQPEFKFLFVKEMRGMELIEATRRQPPAENIATEARNHER